MISRIILKNKKYIILIYFQKKINFKKTATAHYQHSSILHSKNSSHHVIKQILANYRINQFDLSIYAKYEHFGFTLLPFRLLWLKGF
jgi:alpha-galactosidase